MDRLYVSVLHSPPPEGAPQSGGEHRPEKGLRESYSEFHLNRQVSNHQILLPTIIVSSLPLASPNFQVQTPHGEDWRRNYTQEGHGCTAAHEHEGEYKCIQARV